MRGARKKEVQRISSTPLTNTHRNRSRKEEKHEKQIPFGQCHSIFIQWIMGKSVFLLRPNDPFTENELLQFSFSFTFYAGMACFVLEQ